MQKRDILLDVDGVAADFVEGLEKALDYRLGNHERKEWDFLKVLPSEHRSRALVHLSNPDFWRNLPVIEGAKRGVDYLEDLGYEISWVTSPWTSCDSWEAARRDWLNKHFDWERQGHHYIPTSSKHKIKGDVFIDDKPKNVIDYKAAHPYAVAFIYDQPYNSSFCDAPRFTWDNVKSLRSLV